MKVIVVDDDAGSRSSVARFLTMMKHEVIQFDSAEAALALLRTDYFPVVLSDIKMPKISGIDLLREVSLIAAEKRPKVVLFTGHGSMETAIEALRMGAYDYLLKPVKAEELFTVIDKIATPAGATDENRPAGKDRKAMRKVKEISLGAAGELFVFSSPMEEVVAQALKYHEDRSIPVLIQGETGTGKELIARLIHSGGQKEERPFIDINCAAISPSLFESELFGYKAGSFTGGRGKDQEGKFDIARGGTLFLDEVAEIPIELQAKLLRVVEERAYYRVGGLQKIFVDARIICATNVNLRQAVEEGKFRRDLYYRLQVGGLFLPPLRERKEDILPLASAFLIKFSRQRNKCFTRISKGAEGTLLNYHWPGNIRELKNIIMWAVFMYDEDELKANHLDKAHLLTTTTGTGSSNLTGEGLESDGSLIERHVGQLVQEALHKHNGNKAATARYLGISRRSLYRLLERNSF